MEIQSKSKIRTESQSPKQKTHSSRFFINEKKPGIQVMLVDRDVPNKIEITDPDELLMEFHCEV
ncbi:MAG: hypothetical protein GF353_02185 [Candidatus Lokiarchaeota archaeon]|nr:hypothetical protein [Candidatus Lokiarchaeota archaeon]